MQGRELLLPPAGLFLGTTQLSARPRSAAISSPLWVFFSLAFLLPLFAVLIFTQADEPLPFSSSCERFALSS